MKKLVFCAAFVAAMCMAGTTTSQAQDVKKKEVKKEQCDKKDSKACCKKEKKACCKKEADKKTTDGCKHKADCKAKAGCKDRKCTKDKGGKK